MLTQEQRSIIHSDAQHKFVVASAGSGKSYTIIQYIKHLIKDLHVDPTKILLTSFSRVANSELYEKLEKNLGEAIADKIYLGTIHSLCYRIIQEHKAILRIKNVEIVSEAYLSAILFNNFGGSFESKKEARKTVDIYRKGLLSGVYPPDFTQKKSYCDQAQVLMEEKSRYLYDDLLLKTNRLFKINAPIKQLWANKFEHLIIDECQDTSHIQWEIITHLLRDTTKTCIVGDAKQNIYAFRGASYVYMDQFRQAVNARVYPLSETFRFGQPFADLANKVVDHLEIDAIYKTPTITKVANATEPVFYDMSYTAQVSWIAQDIAKKLEAKQYKHQDLNIVYRYNKEAIPFAKELLSRGIPFKLKAGDIYERSEIKFIIKICTLLNKFTITDCMELFAQYSNFIGDKTLTSIYHVVQANIGGLFSEAQTEEELTANEFFKMAMQYKIAGIGDKKKEALSEMADRITNLTAYMERKAGGKIDFIELAQLADMDDAKFMKDAKQEDSEVSESDDRWSFLHFFNDAYKKATPADAVAWYNEQLLAGHKTKENDADSVLLKTVHGCKGQSLPVVYFVGNRVANPMFMTSEEETTNEMFVLYVALTRAEKELYIFHDNPAGFMFNFIFPETCSDVEPETASAAPVAQVNPQLRALNMLVANYRVDSRKLPRKLKSGTALVSATARAVLLKSDKAQFWVPLNNIGYDGKFFYVSHWVVNTNSLHRYCE